MTKKIIYVKLPKTAGTSLRDVLRKQISPCVEIYTETRKWQWPSLKELHQARLIILGEVVAKKFKSKHPQIWKAARSFSIVRNPYDKTISAWKYCKSTKDKELSHILTSAMPRNKFWTRDNHDYIHFTLSQSHCLTSKGELVVDKFFKYEDIIKNTDALSDYLGLPSICLPHKNKTLNRKNEDSENLNRVTMGKIYKKYKDDFKYFNYPKESYCNVTE